MQSILCVISVLLLPYATSARGSGGGKVHTRKTFDYAAFGPKKWPQLFPSSCNGRKQSPIAIETKSAVYDPKLLSFQYFIDDSKNYELSASNDGHKIYIKFPLVSPLSANDPLTGEKYFSALQLHWHWGKNSQSGSEHSLDRQFFAAEAHMVMWNSRNYPDVQTAVKSPNGLAVLGVFFNETGKDNPLITMFEPLISNPILIEPNKSTEVKFTVNATTQNIVAKFLPNDINKFFRYEGGLTTPGCTENVLWTVYATPVDVSKRQLELFRRLKYPDGSSMVDNFRPPQPLNVDSVPGAKRVVYRSFGQSDSVRNSNQAYSSGTDDMERKFATSVQQQFTYVMLCVVFPFLFIQLN